MSNSQDLWIKILGGFRLGVLAGPFDQFSVDEGRPGAHERHEVRGVDGAPAVLRGFDELERHGHARRP